MQVTITLSPVSFVSGCLVTALLFQAFSTRSAWQKSSPPTHVAVVPSQDLIQGTWQSPRHPDQQISGQSPYQQPDPLPQLTGAIPLGMTSDELELLKTLDPSSPTTLPHVSHQRTHSPISVSDVLKNEDDLTREVLGEQLGDLAPEQVNELMSIRSQLESSLSPRDNSTEKPQSERPREVLLHPADQ